MAKQTFNTHDLEVNIAHIQKLEIRALNVCINVYIENFGNGSGKISVSDESTNWSVCWNAMSKPLVNFFCSCDNDYLITKLDPYLSATIPDFGTFNTEMRRKIIEMRKWEMLTPSDARSLYSVKDWSSYVTNNPYEPLIKPSELDLTDDEWREISEDSLGNFDVPQKTNPRYEYVENIVNIVKIAIVKAGLIDDK
ncbi:hypothetical protein [Photobacterium damselae]|uniref:hypothetical protein n=1 Tax=Photobacterium damselae TaxID=38293 RepID=UPI001F3D51BF|nr:hypothetical protein [Photobacterium damselae]UKA05030.1 hypothetical protein IHC89_22550 [Photobacterium damselae subsp. damselae]